MLRKFEYLFLFLILSSTLLAQNKFRTIRGQIIAQKSAEPLSFATVHIGTGAFGVVSDSLGKFELKIPRTYFADTLTASHIGYFDFKRNIRGLPASIIIELREEVETLDTVKVMSSNKEQKFAGYKDIKAARRFNTVLFNKISIDSALNRARIENKYLLLYFSAKWCGPCNWMEFKVFTDSLVRSAMTQKYIPMKLDADKLSSKSLIANYGVIAYPTFIVLDDDAAVVKRDLGMKDRGQFLTFLNAPMSKTEVEPTDYEKKRIDLGSNRKRSVRPEVGIELGITSNDKLGFNSRLFLAFEKKRIFVRPGVGYTTLNSSDYRDKRLTIPVDLGYTFSKTVLFGLPGGFRGIAAPYYGLLLNTEIGESKTDFGFKYGFESFVGDTSKLALAIFYGHSINNSGVARLSNNNGVYFSALLTL